MMQQWPSVNAPVGVGSRESPEPARFGDFANAEHAMVEEHMAPQNWSCCDCVVSHCRSPTSNCPQPVVPLESTHSSAYTIGLYAVYSVTVLDALLIGGRCDASGFSPPPIRHPLMHLLWPLYAAFLMHPCSRSCCSLAHCHHSSHRR